MRYRWQVKVQLSGQTWWLLDKSAEEVGPEVEGKPYALPSLKTPHSFKVVDLETGLPVLQGEMPPAKGVGGFRFLEFVLSEGNFSLKIFRLTGWTLREVGDFRLEPRTPRPIVTVSKIVGEEGTPAPTKTPIPCFGLSRRLSYGKGVRVGPLEGFRTFSVKVSDRHYIHVNNCFIVSEEATRPLLEFPTFLPDGRWMEIGSKPREEAR